MAANQVQHDRSKHIAVDYHFVWERVVVGDLIVCYIFTTKQIADIFTEGLLPTVSFLRCNLSVRPPEQLQRV